LLGLQPGDATADNQADRDTEENISPIVAEDEEEPQNEGVVDNGQILSQDRSMETSNTTAKQNNTFPSMHVYALNNMYVHPSIGMYYML
jgi:hypothetical protein